MISPPHINGGQSIELGENSPWCTVAAGMIHCKGSQRFTSSREMWWYLAISRCLNSTYSVSRNLLLSSFSLWISWSPWRGFCGHWEVFGDLHYIYITELGHCSGLSPSVLLV